MFFKSKNHQEVEQPAKPQKAGAGGKLQQLLSEHAAKVRSLSAEVKRQKRELAQYRRRFAREDEFLFDSYPLTEIADRLNQHLDYGNIIQNLIEICNDLRGVEAAGSFLLLEKEWNLQQEVNHPVFLSLFEELYETGLLDTIQSELKTVLLKGNNYKEILESDVDQGCLLLIPLCSKAKFWGILAVFTVLSEDAASGPFQGQLEMMAAQASVALRYTYIYKDLETTHFELARSQAMLVRAARMAATGEVAGGVAHEINNPLQVILGKIQIARIKNDPNMLEEVESQVLRIATIVKGLQNIALESTSESKSLTDLNQVLTYAYSLVKSQLTRRGIKVIMEKGSGLPAVEISATTLRQTIIAFLVFCKKRLRSGGELIIQTDVESPYCKLVFEDNGTTLSETLIRQIKEPLSASGKYGENEENFGIVVCALLVKDGKGDIDVETTETDRTRITIKFPAYGPQLNKTAHTDVTNEVSETD